MVEQWKAIKDYEGLYEVSDLGRVRSLDRKVIHSNGREHFCTGTIIKGRLDKNGRYLVDLHKNGKSKTTRRYVLVAEAFIGPRPEGYDVCHIDGDLSNNKLSNLKYDTRTQNRIDIYRYGSRNPKSKLTIEDVLEIRRLEKTKKYKQIEIAKMFNVRPLIISRIVRRETFSWLNDEGTIDDSKTSVSAS